MSQMTVNTTWVFVLLLGFGFAAVAASRESARLGGIAASVVALGVILLGITGLDAYVMLDPVPTTSLLAPPDALAAPFMIVTLLIAIGTLVMAPRLELDRSRVQDVLVTTACTLGLLSTRNLGLFAVLWTAALLPTGLRLLIDHEAPHRRAVARGLLFLLGGSGLPMLALTVVLGVHGASAGLESPFDLASLAAIPRAPATASLTFGLLAIAVAVRMGVLPLHLWLPTFVERGPVAPTTILVGVQVGLFAMVRVGIPLWPTVAPAAMPILADIALVGGVAAAAIALVQNDLSRTVAFVAASQSGLILVGAASLNVESLHGALLEGLGVGLATAGLVAACRSIAIRRGSTDVRLLGGLIGPMPRAGWLFFALAVAAVGFPGFLGFVGDDLLIHGMLDAHPAVAASMLLAMALNGITMFRAFARAFLGRSRGHDRTEAPPVVEDFLPRERWVAAGLVLLLLAFGLAPGPLLSSHEPVVRGLLSAVAGHE